MFEKYADEAIKKTVELLNIDSPTGYTSKIAAKIQKDFEKLGYKSFLTVKGGVAVDLGGTDTNNGAMLFEAHADTLGGMVHEIKSDGKLKLTPLGGLNANNCEGENCRIITKCGKNFEGCFQLINASIHVNGEYNKTERTFDSCEVIIDENVNSADDVKALGIASGDIVCFEPRTRVTESGYIKSRFLDDKLSVGIIYAFAKYLKEQNITPSRRIYSHITVYEEVGHGGAAIPFENISEVISVDMGCVGEGLSCTERQVSICAKDSGGPYSYDMVKKLIDVAKKYNADYETDIYPYYGSDVEATLRAGHDVRHGLIGAGVYASHGYERSHIKGAENTIKLLAGLIQ